MKKGNPLEQMAAASKAVARWPASMKRMRALIQKADAYFARPASATSTADTPQRFLCREHGLGVVADEDGCCAMCGGDCAIVAVIVDFPDEPDTEEKSK